MEHVEVSHRYAAAPEEVWEIYTDHASWRRWAGLYGSRLEKEGSPDRNGVGAIRAFVGGVREEITEFVPPEHMAYRVVGGPFPVKNHSAEVVFEPAGTGTKLVWTCDFESKIPGAGRALRQVIERTFRRALDGLESRLVRGPQGSDLTRTIRTFLPAITAAHRVIFEASGGRVGNHVAGFNFLILEHVGRKSGKLRTTPLLYIPDGDCFVVAGSNAGQDRDPIWWRNLQAYPDVMVRIGTERVPVRARRATPDEEAELWPQLKERWSFFTEYQEHTDRTIPLVILGRKGV